MKSVFQWIKNYRIFVAAISAFFFVLCIGLRMRAKSSEAQLLSEPIQKGSIIESVYGIGTVTARRSFQAKSGVTSTIRKLFAKEGDFVERGKPLVSLDGETVFTAPFDGTVTSLPFKIGESVFSQTVILNLVDLSDRYVVVSLQQQGAIRIHHGQGAKLSFEGMRAESYEGVVESVYSNENNFLVRINTPNLPPQILPGMTADVAIGITEHKGVWVVPVAAILANTAYVKREHGGIEIIRVQTGIVDGAMAEIISGDLHPGDRLLINRKMSP